MQTKCGRNTAANRYFTFATNLNHNKQITYAKQTYYKQARAEEAFLLGCFLIGKYVCICPNRHTAPLQTSPVCR